MPDGEEGGADEARRVPNRMPDPVGEVVTALEAFGVDRRQVGTDSTPFGILSPGLGSSTLETRRQAALEAVLQTQTDPLPVSTSPSRFPPHAESHMAGGDDEVHSFDIISVYDQLLMRPGWEDESLRGTQEEITPATGGAIQTQMFTDFVTTPLIRLYSAAKPSGERVRAEFAAKQGSLTYPVVRVVLVDSSDTPIREATISTVVDLGASDFVRLSMRGDTVAGGLTELNLDCTNTSASLATFTGTTGRMRVTGIATPLIGADATSKDYVDGLTVPVAAEGDIIIANATPAWIVLSVGAPRQLLQVNAGGTRPEWASNIDIPGTLDVTGAAVFDSTVDIIHTAAENDDHALEIDVDAAGFGDVKAVDVVYDTGTIASGEDEAVILVDINEFDAGGGEVIALEVLATSGGADAIWGMKAGAIVGPILQDSGTFANPNTATNNTATTNVADMKDGSTGTNTTIFVADDDYIIIGATNPFTEIEFNIETPAANPGIKPTFEYSKAAGAWAFFSPVDGTNGFRNSGVIAWDASDLTDHAVHTSGGDPGDTYDIRITRTHAVAGSVSLFFAKTAATVVFFWDKDGNIDVLSVKTDTLIEKTSGAGVTIDTAQIKDNGIVFIEAADHPIAAAATKGQIWVKTASPNELWFTDDVGTDIQLGAAGHAKYTDAEAISAVGGETQTRTVMLLMLDFSIHTGTPAYEVGVSSVRRRFDDGTTEEIIAQFVVPEDYVSGGVIRLYYTMASATSGDVRWFTRVASKQEGESLSTSGSTDTANDTAQGTAANVGIVDITTSETLAAGDVANLRVGRSGASGLDTATGDALLHAVELVYEASAI
ncbi:hypothetical protein LCGC14_0825900 [marine sediment metagenome]|uniref:Uncharacterized protein n=1 Tax=marine sediment metagenome TaxID=412755 RepID=A0A0F9S269_9ZZZZ